MPPVADPVSWLMIKPGWDVFAVDGTKFGEVDLVAGDDTADIFDGLAVATSALGEPRYVAAERVARIEDGPFICRSRASSSSELDVYLEPATSATIEPTAREASARRCAPTCASSRARSSRRPSSTSTR